MVPATALEDHLEEIRRLIEGAEKDPQTHTFARLADLYQKTGQLDRALEVIENGLEQHPYYLNARLVHASVLRKLDRLPEARCTLERVLQIDSENLVARTALIEIGPDGATVQTDAASPEMSRPQNSDGNRWLEAFDVDWSNTSVDGDHNAAKIISQGEEETRMIRGEAVQSSPAPANSISEVLDTATLASLYVEQGFFTEAIEVYERLISRSPHNSELAVKLEHVRECAEKSRGERVPPDRAERIRIPVAEPVSNDSSPAGTPLRMRRRHSTEPKARDPGSSDQGLHAGAPSVRDHLGDEDVKSGFGGFKGWSRWLARFKKDSN
jgi:tetratricopeptide (TPR) repeat protein